MGSFLMGATGTGNGFQASAAPIVDQDLTKQITNAQGQFNQSFNAQNQLGGQLQAMANGIGPNPAQIQLQQATDNNIKQNAGMLASQKGLSPELAQRLAAQNQAQMGQQAAGQGALMGAQQQMSAMQQLGSLYGQQQQGALGMNNNLQNAVSSQNSAHVGATSNMNSVNGATAQGNQAMSGKLAGGLLGGAASAFGLAHGGSVPPVQKLAGGGFAQGFVDGFNGPSNNQQNQQQHKPLFDLPGAIKGWMNSGSSSSPSGGQTDDEAEQGYLDADGMMNDMDQASGVGMMHTVDMPAASDAMGAAESSGGPMEALGAMMAAKGGKVPNKIPGVQYKDDGGGIAKLLPLLALLAKGGQADPQGTVPGKAVVAGDSLKNDKVPAMLSPREIVIPRSITTHQNAPEMAAEFVRRELAKNQHKSKKNYADGGMSVPAGLSADAPEVGPAPVNLGVDLSTPPPVDPMVTKRQMYNDLLERMPSNFLTDAIGLPGGKPEQAFGPNGEAPKEFNPKMWAGAEKLYQQQNQLKDQAAIDTYQKTIQENQLRMQAGLHPLPVPTAPAALLGGAPGAGAATPGPDMNAIGNQQQMGGMMNPMMAGDEALMKGYQGGLNKELAGLNMYAKSQEDLGKQNAALAHQGTEDQQKVMEGYKTKHEELMGLYDNAMKAYQDKELDPNHYTNNLGTVGKVKTAIGLVLGGLSGGLLGTENPAMKFLNQQIDRDIETQRMDLGKKQNLLTANFHKLGDLKDATEMTRGMLMGIQANQFKEAAANAQGPQARALALQAAGQKEKEAAQVIGPIAMRQALMKGMGQGQSNPEMNIQFMAPPHEREKLMSDLKAGQSMVKQKDNLLNAFDQVNKLATVGGAITSPLQNPRQRDALVEPLLAQLIKDSEGRITPQDTEMMKGLFPRPGDDDRTRVIRRSQLNKFISEKMNFPSLRQYGFNPSGLGRYDEMGRDKLPPMAPPRR